MIVEEVASRPEMQPGHSCAFDESPAHLVMRCLSFGALPEDGGHPRCPPLFNSWRSKVRKVPDRAYYERRARAETRKAALTDDAVSRRVHLVLAANYLKMLNQLDEEAKAA